jgi:hypothetical protein
MRMMRALKETEIMTTQAMTTKARTVPHRRGASYRAPTNLATLIAVTLFLAVLIAEAVFLVLNAPSVAELGTLAAGAGSVP